MPSPPAGSLLVESWARTSQASCSTTCAQRKHIRSSGKNLRRLLSYKLFSLFEEQYITIPVVHMCIISNSRPRDSNLKVPQRCFVCNYCHINNSSRPIDPTWSISMQKQNLACTVNYSQFSPSNRKLNVHFGRLSFWYFKLRKGKTSTNLHIFSNTQYYTDFRALNEVVPSITSTSQVCTVVKVALFMVENLKGEGGEYPVARCWLKFSLRSVTFSEIINLDSRLNTGCM
jgi:hypothetical protein